MHASSSFFFGLPYVVLVFMFMFSWQTSTQLSSIINLSQKSTIPYTQQFSTRTCSSRKSNISKALPITNPRIDPHKQTTPTTALPSTNTPTPLPLVPALPCHSPPPTPSTQTKPKPQTPNPYPDNRIPQVLGRNSFAIKTVLIKSNQINGWMDMYMIITSRSLKKRKKMKHQHQPRLKVQECIHGQRGLCVAPLLMDG